MHATSAPGSITTTRIHTRRSTHTNQLRNPFRYTCVRTSGRSDDEHRHSWRRTRQALSPRLAGRRWPAPLPGSLPPLPHRVAAQKKRRDVLGAERRVIASEGRRGPWPDRAERGGQDDAAEDSVAYHAAHHRLGRDSWPRRLAARSRHGLPSRT